MAQSSEKINSVNELYERVLPALNTREMECKRMNILYIKANEMWNFLAKNKWQNKKDLRIYEMVDDILNADQIELIEYWKSKHK